MRRAVLLFTSVMVGVVLACCVAQAALLLKSTPDPEIAQPDGEVSAIAVSGNTVYLAGNFTHVNGVQRDHLAAIDASSGQLTSWAPRANGAVKALAVSPKDGRVFAGGLFTTINGVSRRHVAALSASGSGALLKRWKASTDYGVHALALSGGRLYLGGNFTTVNGRPRAHLAWVDRRSGAIKKGAHPSANGTVLTLARSSKRLYVGGSFRSVSGKPRKGLAALNAATGTLNNNWRPITNGTVFDVQSSGGRVYSAEGGPGGVAAAYNSVTGGKIWRQSANGDVQTVSLLDGKAYFGGYFGTFAGQGREALAAVDTLTGALDSTWTPQASPRFPGVWALTADATLGRLYAEGDFTSVSGQPHQYAARFSQ